MAVSEMGAQGACVVQETQSCHVQSEEDEQQSSETPDTNDGRWDFVKILGQDA